MGIRGKVTGGLRLARYLKQKRRQVQNLDGRTFDVGFLDPRIAGLAAVHEFGHGDIPERPAFRSAGPAVRRAVQTHARAVAYTVVRPESRSDQIEVAIQGTVQAAKDALTASYLAFEGTPLSDRQRARKRGSPHEDTELVGREGPRLIGHIDSKERKG